MSNEEPQHDRRETVYDLEERTALFGEAIIRFAKKIPQNTVTKSLTDQLVRAGTSVGSNYCEADDAVSKRDFRHKISICKKEARETKHWLRMIAIADADMKVDARTLWQEAKELHLIFAAIVRRKS
jgi:four helix bundle protein